MRDKRNVITSRSDLDILIQTLASLGYDSSWSGLCIWIDATQSHDELKRLGARWSGKRSAWYIRSDMKQETTTPEVDYSQSIYADEMPF